MGNFRTVEHTADVAFELHGESLEDLLVQAAIAVRYAWFGAKSPDCDAKRKFSVAIQAEGKEELLVTWVNELIFQGEANGLYFCGFAKPLVVQTEPPGYRLTSVLYAAVEPQGLQCELKAATFHNLVITHKSSGELTATLVIDT